MPQPPTHPLLRPLGLDPPLRRHRSLTLYYLRLNDKTRLLRSVSPLVMSPCPPDGRVNHRPTLTPRGLPFPCVQVGLLYKRQKRHRRSGPCSYCKGLRPPLNKVSFLSSGWPKLWPVRRSQNLFSPLVFFFVFFM